MIIFRPTGSTNVLTIKGSSPALLSGINIDPNLEGINNAGIIVTGVALSHGVNIAYFTTLSESVYIYPLGNKIGKCLITGMAFPTCNNSGYSNVDKIVKFYNDNKASNFTNITNPIKITIGKTNINGYLEAMELSIGSNPEDFGMAKFSFTLSVMPAGQK
jgi:hypothetical protein